MTSKSIEDSYCLKDAEHTPGTNRYTFTYNHHWRSITQEHLTLSVRSVKLWRQPRNLWVDNIVIHSTEANTDTPTSFDVSITGPMTEFNDKLANLSNGYRVYYNPKNGRIVFDCDESHYFTSLSSATCSADFKAITGVDSFSELTVLATDESEHVLCFCFDNVWNREDVHVRASFVDLGYQNFLGVSNEQFTPPKEYAISFTDKKFTLDLFDSLDRPTELPPDETGGMLLELILKAST